MVEEIEISSFEMHLNLRLKVEALMKSNSSKDETKVSTPFRSQDYNLSQIFENELADSLESKHMLPLAFH